MAGVKSVSQSVELGEGAVPFGRLDGRLIVHLVNTAGPHANAKVHLFDEIPAVGPLTVTIRTARPRDRPERISLG